MKREPRGRRGKRSGRRYFNREMSWLEFNRRVLEEALDATNPAAERLKFLAIVSSNLDEFFAVRVAGLKHQETLAPARTDPSGMTATEQLDAIRDRVRGMVEDQYACLAALWPILESGGAALKTAPDLTREQRAYLDGLFDREILPTLTPMAVDGERRFPVLADGQVCLGVCLEGPKGDPHVAVVPIPRVAPRLLNLPAESGVQTILVEDALRMFLPRLFQGCTLDRTVLFRPTRDADLSVEEEKDEDFAVMMSDILRRRRRSSVVRLEVEKGADPDLLRFFQERMEVRSQDVYAIPGPLDLKAFFGFAGLPAFAPFRNEPWTPQPVPGLGEDDDIWRTIRSRDVLLHHPYDAFDPVVSLLERAAEDPDTLAVKITLYRCGGDSKVIRALERAAENGKHVTAVVELKARFDEGRNIEWARRLEDAGAQVIYGVVGLKIHSKACVIVRREPEGIRRYVHLATGNYNENTAKLYTDLGLMTCDEGMGADVSAYFNTVTGYSQPAQWLKIEMAPIGMKRALIGLIEREAEKSSHDQPGLVMAKMNSLLDADVIEALYAASMAGARILLNVRGVCALRPGVEGMSERIEVVSIVDRFLEHSRAFYFLNGGDEEVYLSSADWMPRNLEKRVELMFPIEAPPLKARVKRILETFMSDNVKARRLKPEGSYERVPTRGEPVRAQEVLMQRALRRWPRADNAAKRELRPRRPVS